MQQLQKICRSIARVMLYITHMYATKSITIAGGNEMLCLAIEIDRCADPLLVKREDSCQSTDSLAI